MKIKQHPYRIVCDICPSRDTYMIEKPGIPVSQCQTLCKKDLLDLIKTGIEFFKDEIELPVPEDYEQIKAEVERLKVELEAATTEINRLGVELEAGSAEINRLTVELEVAKKNGEPMNNPAPNKGGKKK